MMPQLTTLHLHSKLLEFSFQQEIYPADLNCSWSPEKRKVKVKTSSTPTEGGISNETWLQKFADTIKKNILKRTTENILPNIETIQVIQNCQKRETTQVKKNGGILSNN